MPIGMPGANPEDLLYIFRYGMGKDAYEKRAKELRDTLPPEVQALAKGNPNIIDRYAGQRIATESGPMPDPIVGLANRFALGDPFLDKQTNESERTKQAGDIGRAAGSAPAAAAVLPAPTPRPGYGLQGAEISPGKPEGIMEMLKRVLSSRAK
jgi:hypothetical protein